MKAIKSATPFDSLQPEWIAKRKHAHEVCRNFNRSPSKGNLKRLKSLFQQCGEPTFIEAGFLCDYGDHIRLGQHVFINANCTLLDGGAIEIGDDCLIGPNVQILTINHPLDPQQRLQKTNLAQPVILGKNVWVGAGAIICPGVEVGDNAVIAAGSVVCHAVASNTLVAGNPAKIKKQL